MAFDTIKAGLQVITRNGRMVGAISAVTRHPVTRAVLAVVIAPEGTADPQDFIVTSARNLRAV